MAAKGVDANRLRKVTAQAPLTEVKAAQAVQPAEQAQPEILINKKANKTKVITYPDYWETEIFNKNLKDIGKDVGVVNTWGAYIRQAIGEKLKSDGMDL